MPSADLYLGKINFQRYLDDADCAQCGYPTCADFMEAVKTGKRQPSDCMFVDKNKAYAFSAINKIKETWPEVPMLVHPRPGYSGLVELNEPDSESFVLLSGNNEYTEEVLMTVLSTTICPFFVIFVDTDGNTVDMAMIYRTLTAERISRAIRETEIEQKTRVKELMIPGLVAPLKEEIQELTGWNVRVGPVCAAELPLFLSEIWIPPDIKGHG